MNVISLEEEADDCRRKALAYVGQREATFLLRVAREFDRLASERKRAPAHKNLQQRG